MHLNLRNGRAEISGLRWLAISPVLLLVFSPLFLLSQETTSGTASFSEKTLAKKIFATHCAICHGADALGGEYGPRLAGSTDLQGKSISWIHSTIHNGIPSAGMPAFNLPDNDLDALAAFVYSLNITAMKKPAAGDRVAGQRYFFAQGKCATCHMAYGQGSAIGPDLSDVAQRMTAEEIRSSLVEPSASFTAGYQPATVRLKDGTMLHGFIRSQTNFEIALQDFDGRFHLLEKDRVAEIKLDQKSPMPPFSGSSQTLQNLVSYLSELNGVKPGMENAGEPSGKSGIFFSRSVHPQPGEWLTYNGNLSGNRFSELNQIKSSNVNQLQLKWIYTVPLWRQFYPDTPYYRENMQYFGLETTPLVADGIMYATGPQQVFALDARTGMAIWIYSRTRTPGVVGDGSLGSNRGLAILGDNLFMVTDNAHLVALNRITGKLVWEAVMPEKPMHYGGTSAPLVVKNMVIAGVSGADWGVRGFLAAFRASDGELLWRHWTIPAKGEPGSETWGSNPPETGGGSTWTTGSYDPETDTVYWATGNPYPDGDASSRPGDDLYTNGILALNPNNGQTKWFYQVTPHDVHDWDTTAPLILVDTVYHGQKRKLLLHADKNGFFYVLDRTNGHVLTAKPFVKVNWASGIGPDGRPQRIPEDGVICPEAGSNWNAAAFSPLTNLYYVIASESCAVEFSAAKQKRNSAEKIVPRRYLEALDLDGRIAWRVLQFGPVDGKRDGGILATAGGLLFYGEPSGDIVAADAATGKTLWHFPASGENKASPMTYTVNGKQFVSLAVGPNILGISLTSPTGGDK